jgi:benzoyl-CoA reductase/2-hydroxyglutaryl-CoA dehydratase subunit BcrC/BadD/HgdB
MISYEELCEALDRHNKRRRNEAELKALEGGAPAPLTGDSPTFSLRDTTDGFKQPAEDTHEIDVDEVVVDDK